MAGAGDRFQQQTKYDPDRMPMGPGGSYPYPSPYKQYPNARRIDLPAAEAPGAFSLDQALRERRSVRRFSGRAVTVRQLSYLLWACTGVREREGGFEFRTAPSAGALYPIETYLVVNNVSDLEQGLYHYAIAGHQLEKLAGGDYRRQIAAAALGQSMCAEAAVVFVWSAIFGRTCCKYGQRGYRYVYLDAGHIAANLALAAVALGLGSCQIGALYDDRVNAVFGLDGTAESVVYMSVVGYPAGAGKHRS